MVTISAAELAAIVIVSVLIGSVIGVFIIALCTVAKNEDEYYETLIENENQPKESSEEDKYGHFLI